MNTSPPRTPERARLPGSTPRRVRALTRRLLPWFDRVARDLPWRRTRDPYAVWISEIMLQQTQVATVVPYYERWMKALPDVRRLARATSPTLHKLWEGLGYYTRVRNLQAAARIICREHGGRFPTRFSDVLALPGIGRYTAGAISSIAFNQPEPVVDGNVTRVLTRLFGIGQDPREPRTTALLWELAGRLVREAAGDTRHPAPCSALNQALMELGATLCTPRNPQCTLCPARGQCTAHREHQTDRLPARRARPPSIRKQVQAFAIRHRGRYLVVRRPEDEINGGLWEFPSREVRLGTQGPEPGPACDGMRLSDAEAIMAFQHSITRFRITLQAFHARTRQASRPVNGQWFTAAELRDIPLSAAHRRIARKLGPRGPLAC